MFDAGLARAGKAASVQLFDRSSSFDFTFPGKLPACLPPACRLCQSRGVVEAAKRSRGYVRTARCFVALWTRATPAPCLCQALKSGAGGNSSIVVSLQRLAQAGVLFKLYCMFCPQVSCSKLVYSLTCHICFIPDLSIPPSHMHNHYLSVDRLRLRA